MAARRAKANRADLPVKVTGSFSVPALAGDFTTGTDGQTQRASWARTSQGPMGFGWDASAGTMVALQPGGRPAREANLASAVANELVTSNPTLATIVNSHLTNTLGTGLTLSSKPVALTLGIEPDVARLLSHQFETAFNAWAMNPLECDASGRSDLHEMATCFLRYILLSGEGVASIDWRKCRGARTRTKVCILDNRQIDYQTSLVTDKGYSVNGVVFDKAGRLLGYMLRDVPIAGFATPTAKFVEAYTSWGRPRVIHVFERIDARQVRGLSSLVAALTPAHERESLVEFQMANSLIQTQFAMTIESDLPSHVALEGLDPHDGRRGMDDYMSNREQFYEKTKLHFAPGNVTHLPMGDKLKMNKVANGGDTFAPFNEALVRSASRAAGAQVEEISGDYSKTSFSASRMAGELPYRATLKRRKMIERFYQLVFQCWADEAIETGVVELPAGAPDYWSNRQAYTNAKWLGIGRTEPDRKKAAEAVALELEMGLTTFEDALAERGIDFESHVENIAAERVIMRAAGIDKPIFPGSVTTQIRDDNIVENDAKGDRHDD